jgi:anti-sigma regulatory factor (Ser/Thr protein kinase)
MVGNIAHWVGFDEVQSGQISLAVDEALCNVIKHGYGRRDDMPIWLSLWALEGKPTGIKIVIEDLATQVDPKKIQGRNLDDIRPGGLGVYIIRQIMDEVVYEQRPEGGMRLTLIRHVPSQVDTDAGCEPAASCENEPEHG